jgi:hypothetical protein
MKVKDLRQILKGLPANMEVLVDTGIQGLLEAPAGYNSILSPIKKAKTKLHKTVKGYNLVQSRPHKDEKAKLSLILE